MVRSAEALHRRRALDYNKDFLGGGKGALYGNYDTDALVFAIWMGTTGTPEDSLSGALLVGGSAIIPTSTTPTLPR